MAASKSDIQNLGEAIHELLCINAKAHGAMGIIGMDGTGAKTNEDIMYVYFLLDDMGKDLKRLANQLDEFDLKIMSQSVDSNQSLVAG